MKKIITLLFLMALVCVKGWGQIVNTYTQTTGSSTYVSQAATGNTISGSPWDDNNYTTTLPFAFTYNGVVYASGTVIYVNSNGYITFGSAPTNSNQSAISSTNGYAGAIAAVSGDLAQEATLNTFAATWTTGSTSMTINSGTVPSVGTTLSSSTAGISGAIVNAVSGTTITLSTAATSNKSNKTVTFSPANTSKIITKTVGSKFYIEWVNADYYDPSNGPLGTNLNFQIVLNQDNSININYGQMSMGVGESFTPAVGLRGSSNSDFIDLSGSWSSPTKSTSNNSLTQTLSGSIFPALGLTYTFTPPAPCTTPSVPTSVTTGQTTTTTIPGTITAPTTAPSGYVVVTSANSTLSAGPANGTTYTAGGSLGGGTVQYVGSSTSFSVTSLTSNTKYYVFVYSYNSGCSGAPYYSTTSATTNATTIPSAPIIGTATAGNASASVAFTGPGGTAIITGYTATSNPGGITGTGTTSPIIVNGLTNGTAYTFTVTATNAGGTSAPSAASTSVTPVAPCTTPSAPTSVTLGTSTTTAQAGTIGVPTTAPTGYLVVASTSPTLSAAPVNGTPYTAGSSLGGGTVQYVNTTASFTAATTLSSNTNYYYFVYSYNSGCAGAPYYSTTSATANNYTCIAAPTGLAAGSITTTSASLSWTASGGTITSYNLLYSTTSGGPYTTVTNVTSPYTLGSLTPGTTYYYVLVANNTANTSSCGTASANSAQSSFATTALTYIDAWVSTSTGSTTWCAGETRMITVTVKNNGTATWVSGTTGVNLSYYWSNQTRDDNPRIYPFTSGAPLAPGQQQAITFAVTAPSTVNTYTLRFDLVKEGSCWFGDNTANCSGPGNTVYTTATQTVGAYPTVATGTATGITPNSGTVPGTITAGCTAITGYGVEYSTTNNFANGTGTPVAGSNLSGTAYTVNITGFKIQVQTYYYHAYVNYSGGTGVSYSAINSFTTLAPACVAPTAQPTATTLLVLGTTAPSSEVDVNYTAPSPAPSGYIIVRYAGSSPAVTAPVSGTAYAANSSLGTGTVVYNGTAASFANTALTANTTYTYYVYDYNNTACSSGPAYNTTLPLNGTITTCVAAPVPSAATAITPTGFTANWAASTGATAYLLDVSTSSTFASFVSGYNGLNVGNVLTYPVTGLSSSTQYYYRVRAIGAAGCTSVNSGSQNPTTLAPACTTPNAPGALSYTSSSTTSITGSFGGIIRFAKQVIS